MINSLITMMELILILISLALILYLIFVKREDNLSNYLMLMFNSCLLWIVLI